MRVDVDGLACPCTILWSAAIRRGGQSFLSDDAMSRHAALSGGAFPGGAKPSGLDILHGVDRLGTYKTESYMEKPAFTEGVLIRCQSYHGDYACTLG
jgi:hypothetical protein